MESSSSGLLVHFRFSARRLQPVSLQASCRMKRQLAGKSNSFLSLARSLTSHSLSLLLRDFSRLSKTKRKEKSREGKIHGKLNASWKISSLAVNGQSFLVIDGYLLNPFHHSSLLERLLVGQESHDHIGLEKEG